MSRIPTREAYIAARLDYYKNHYTPRMLESEARIGKGKSSLPPFIPESDEQTRERAAKWYDNAIAAGGQDLEEKLKAPRVDRGWSDSELIASNDPEQPSPTDPDGPHSMTAAVVPGAQIAGFGRTVRGPDIAASGQLMQPGTETPVREASGEPRRVKVAPRAKNFSRNA